MKMDSSTVARFVEARSHHRFADRIPGYWDVLRSAPHVEEAAIAMLASGSGERLARELAENRRPLTVAGLRFFAPAPSMPERLTLDVIDDLDKILEQPLPPALRQFIALESEWLPGVPMTAPYRPRLSNWPWALPRLLPFACHDGQMTYGLYYPLSPTLSPVVLAVNRDESWTPVASSMEAFFLRLAVDPDCADRQIREQDQDAEGSREPLAVDQAMAVAEICHLAHDTVLALQASCPGKTDEDYHRFVLDRIDPRAPASLLALGRAADAAAVFPEFRQAHAALADAAFRQGSYPDAFTALLTALRSPLPLTGNEAPLAGVWRDRVAQHHGTWSALHGSDPLAQAPWGGPECHRYLAYEQAGDRVKAAYEAERDLSGQDIDSAQREHLLDAVARAGCDWPRRLLARAQELERQVEEGRPLVPRASHPSPRPRRVQAQGRTAAVPGGLRQGPGGCDTPRRGWGHLRRASPITRGPVPRRAEGERSRDGGWRGRRLGHVTRSSQTHPAYALFAAAGPARVPSAW
jgi:hypothetical protein